MHVKNTGLCYRGKDNTDCWSNSLFLYNIRKITGFTS